MEVNIEFEDFIGGNISGKFIINPFWVEHNLNLFFQRYIGEVWCELQDTKINHCDLLDNLIYSMIGDELKSTKGLERGFSNEESK